VVAILEELLGVVCSIALSSSIYASLAPSDTGQLEGWATKLCLIYLLKVYVEQLHIKPWISAYGRISFFYSTATQDWLFHHASYFSQQCSIF
jgi:hypothetical protein